MAKRKPCSKSVVRGSLDAATRFASSLGVEYGRAETERRAARLLAGVRRVLDETAVFQTVFPDVCPPIGGLRLDTAAPYFDGRPGSAWIPRSVRWEVEGDHWRHALRVLLDDGRLVLVRQDGGCIDVRVGKFADAPGSDSVRAILDVLRHGPLSGKEVATRAGLSDSRTRHLLADLVRRKRIGHTAGAGYHLP